jgi:hypothetical protein
MARDVTIAATAVLVGVAAASSISVGASAACRTRPQIRP